VVTSKEGAPESAYAHTGSPGEQTKKTGLRIEEKSCCSDAKADVLEKPIMKGKGTIRKGEHPNR